MKSNIVVKIIGAIAVSVLIVVIAKYFKKDTPTASTAAQVESGQSSNNTAVDMSDLESIDHGPKKDDNGLEVDPMDDEYLEKEYGVDVDSPVETMRTLTNETRAVRQDSEKLQAENKKQKQEIEKLLKMKEELEKRIDGKMNNAQRELEEKERENKHNQELTNGLIEKLQRKIDEFENRGNPNKPTKANQQANLQQGGKTANGYDIGSAGIPSGLGYDDNGNQVDYDQVVWTNPIEASVDPKDPTKVTLPDFSQTIKDKTPAIAKGPTKDKKKTKAERSIKAYTIPVEATLISSVSMTAMLGRIPVNGQVIDPYPFKIIIGEENLSSNGIEIPGVVGIMMSGIAKGDWTLSCVSGDINSMTFTFADGTIQTIPEPGTKAKEKLAWFSDQYGTPCITGKRITNAPSYLTSRVALTAGASYANAQAQSQFTTQTNGTGMTRGLTGDPGVVAQNTAISESINEVTDWLDARQANSFDAIYIPPGTTLHVHVTEELKVDYDPEGRKVNHYANFNDRTNRQLD
jgi:integrating conjugative element protein (TIGR03752 family)